MKKRIIATSSQLNLFDEYYKRAVNDGRIKDINRADKILDKYDGDPHNAFSKASPDEQKEVLRLLKDHPWGSKGDVIRFYQDALDNELNEGPEYCEAVTDTFEKLFRARYLDPDEFAK